MQIKFSFVPIPKFLHFLFILDSPNPPTINNTIKHNFAIIIYSLDENRDILYKAWVI